MLLVEIVAKLRGSVMGGINMSSANTHGELDHKSSSSKLMIAALGVVYGDIGTSPLYAFKQSIEAIGGPNETNILAILSLMIWSLIMVVTVKYVFVILKVNNNGEGGTIALTSIALGLTKTKTGYWIVMSAGLIGVSMFYGDSMITPAISVLSAVEGLNVITPAFESYVIPITLTLIAGFFSIQRFGTEAVGKYFGPIMVIWFLTLAVLGLISIFKNPQVLHSINPYYGVGFLAAHPGLGFVVLGAVVLAVTGGEALYADMGHFGIVPIRRTWLWFVFPALLLNYMGQGSLLLTDPKAINNPFFNLAPSWSLYPMVILATAATIIASQAVISGAFSITNQAVQLGYIPRIRVRHTSDHEIGQVYVNHVNIFLFVCVELLVISFKSSENLANAYGIAVTGSMAIDTALAYFVMVKRENWNPLFAIPLFGLFFCIDISFFSANLIKFIEGGWFPILVASTLFFVMIAWVSGRQRLIDYRAKNNKLLSDWLLSFNTNPLPRIPGTAIFMVPDVIHLPHSLQCSLKHYRALHERVLFMNIKTEMVPYVKPENRIEVIHLEHNCHLVKVHYGFFEMPRILKALAYLRIHEFHFKLSEVSFFVGTEHLINAGKTTWERISDGIFIFLHNNMYSLSNYFRLPPDHVVEIGGEIKI